LNGVPNNVSWFNSHNRVTSLGHDDAGNALSVHGATMTYDGANRMVQTQRPGLWTITYGYDAEGRRVRTDVVTPGTGVSAARRIYVYDAFGKLAAEYRDDAETFACTTCYITRDWLGSTRLVTDETGTPKDRFDYTPFGRLIPSDRGRRWTVGSYNSGLGSRWRFTGKERDWETGVDYFGARYFSDVLGRFASADPYSPMIIAQKGVTGGFPIEAARSQIQDFAENPQSWNRYSYVRNNPLTFVDPFGEAPLPSGHHLIPQRTNLGPIGTEFANSVRTGPLTNNYPNQPGFNTIHRAYNAAAESILQQFERQFGASRNDCR
jgi:RHS repeat-associated protein